MGRRGRRDGTEGRPGPAIPGRSQHWRPEATFQRFGRVLRNGSPPSRRNCVHPARHLALTLGFDVDHLADGSRMTQMDGATPRRPPRARSYLMRPPEHFTVQYAINPWMDPAGPVDTARAMDQWRVLRETFTGLGHQV